MSQETPKTRTRNTRSPLTAGQAFDRISERRDTRGARREALLAEFDTEEKDFELSVIERVPAEQRARVVTLLQNDVPTPAQVNGNGHGEERPAWLDHPAPEPKTKPIVVDRAKA